MLPLCACVSSLSNKGAGRGDLCDVKRQAVVRSARACVCSARRISKTHKREVVSVRQLFN